MEYNDTLENIMPTLKSKKKIKQKYFKVYGEIRAPIKGLYLY